LGSGKVETILRTLRRCPVSLGGRWARAGLLGVLFWGCNLDREGSAPSTSVRRALARDGVTTSTGQARAAEMPAPERRGAPAAPSGQKDLAPGASEEFDAEVISDVRRALSAVDENAFPTLAYEEKRVKPNSCHGWKSLRRRGYAPKNSLARELDAGALVRCGALEFLGRAKPSRISHVEHVLEGAGPGDLPAIVASATSKLAQRSRSAAAAKGLTLGEYLPDARVGPSELLGRVSIVEPASATSAMINVECWGDVNADGIEDLLVSVMNMADDGSYFDMRLLEVTRAAAEAPLRVLAVTQ
jgi:hypothetical protein